MPETKYLYLILMGVSFAGPFLLSFDKKVAFYKSFKILFLSIIPVSGFFIVWDLLFTSAGIWGFNPAYTSGIYFGGLPLGEWLFFFVIPFCCVFVYRVLNAYIHKDILGRHKNSISHFLIGFSACMAIIYYDKWYTVLTFGLLTILIYFHSTILKTSWLGRFYLAYSVILIPLLIINGILTGTGLQGEVVWYNNEENMGIRIFTIPLEDVFYGMLLILGIISIYERLASRQNKAFAYETSTE